MRLGLRVDRRRLLPIFMSIPWIVCMSMQYERVYALWRGGRIQSEVRQLEVRIMLAMQEGVQQTIDGITRPVE